MIAALLSPVGHLYGLSVRLRQGRAPYRPNARVVCVGNLTAGGSGKTPVAIALARMLAARGKKAAFLTRGYGGKLKGPVAVEPARHTATDVGDEALLLAAAGMTIVASDRAAGAALIDRMGIDVIVMDDGFQNFQLAKDLSLVVIDAAFGFGNGRLIPAGPLREKPEQGLARADAVVLMGEGLQKIPFTGPILRAVLHPPAPEALAGLPVFAFAGIGRPEKFFAMLKSAGARVLGQQGFADHHRFSALEMSWLRTTAASFGAHLVTTEKDYVRLGPSERANVIPVPVLAVFTEDRGLKPLLDRLCEAQA